MMHFITAWLIQPAHIALVVSEILALMPIKYSGIIQGVIAAVKAK